MDDGGFELVARDALTVAAFPAELLPAGAGVVVVEAAVATRAHSDVGAPAGAAAEQARERVVAGVAATQRGVLAPRAQQPLRALESEFVEERLVQAWQALAAPDDAAEVGLVLDDETARAAIDARAEGRCSVMLGG